MLFVILMWNDNHVPVCTEDRQIPQQSFFGCTLITKPNLSSWSWIFNKAKGLVRSPCVNPLGWPICAILKALLGSHYMPQRKHTRLNLFQRRLISVDFTSVLTCMYDEPETNPVRSHPSRFSKTGFTLSGRKITPDQVDVPVFFISFMARVWSAFLSASIKTQPKGFAPHSEIRPGPYCFWQIVRTY